MDLVPQTSVKVDDVTVGKVDTIEVDGYHAEVTVLLRKSVKLPDNAEATIRQTSLLGEKFVSLAAPASGASSGRLGDGDTIPLAHSGRNPEVEEVLGALSLLLNGGGVAQLKTISTELNKALGGREGDVRSVLSQLDVFMGQLDTNKDQIVRAIESLNRLAISLNKQKPAITQALDELPRAVASINRQRDDLVKMLRALSDLSARRHAGHPGLQDGHRRQPAVARADPDQAGRDRRRAAEVAAGVPHLPVRGRRGRHQPGPGPQPAHGRLHQPLGAARPRPRQPPAAGGPEDRLPGRPGARQEALRRRPRRGPGLRRQAGRRQAGRLHPGPDRPRSATTCPSSSRTSAARSRPDRS